MAEDLIADLKTLIVTRLKMDIKPEDIDPAAPLFGEGLGLDSIDALELVVGIERQYGIRIADAEVGRQAFASVNALAEFIRAKKAAK
ncbi:MAG: acyl carrier protein [Planctomycetia bacterium]|nr:acyl carrier protein [Planctomycetia bacterium]